MLRSLLVCLLAAPPLSAAPLVGPTLWPSLPRADARAVAQLKQRAPEVAPASVKMLTLPAAEGLLKNALARGASALDVFTDPGLREPGRLYYLSQETVAKLFARYNLHVLTPPSGTAKDGKPFTLQAVVMGAGRVVMLYDRDDFKFKHPDFGHVFRSSGRVTQTIEGPGSLGVDGLSVDMLLHPKIRRLVKVDAQTVRVETSRGNRQSKVSPITKR